jgi:hypothetical protein
MSEFSDLWVVWSFEHDGWWRPGGWGYTPLLKEAGRYTEAEARTIEANANQHHKIRQEIALPLSEALGWKWWNSRSDS